MRHIITGNIFSELHNPADKEAALPWPLAPVCSGHTQHPSLSNTNSIPFSTSFSLPLHSHPSDTKAVCLPLQGKRTDCNLKAKIHSQYKDECFTPDPSCSYLCESKVQRQRATKHCQPPRCERMGNWALNPHWAVWEHSHGWISELISTAALLRCLSGLERALYLLPATLILREPLSKFSTLKLPTRQHYSTQYKYNKGQQESKQAPCTEWKLRRDVIS